MTSSTPGPANDRNAPDGADAQFDIDLTAEELHLLECAAAVEGRDVAEFVISAAQLRAAEVIARNAG